MTAEKRDSLALERALEEERTKRARVLGTVRLCLILPLLVLQLVLGRLHDDPNWQGNLEAYLVYILFASIVLIVSRTSVRAGRLGGLAIPLMDMPMVFYLQTSALPTNDDPTGLVGFTLGAYVFLLVLGALTFDVGLVVLSAAMAFTCQAGLLALVGSDAGGYVVAAIFIAAAAAVLAFSNHRLVGLFRTVNLERMRQERLTELNRAKDQFVATVSHDFRSPLAIVMSSIQTVASDPEMPDATRANFLNGAVRQCRRLQALVTDLLDLARIENRDACRETFRLDELVEEVTSAQMPAYEEKGVTLRVCAPRGASAGNGGGSPIVIEADRRLLGQAIGNLLTNAIKFTPDGGEVEVTWASDDGEVRLSVADTGAGIPVEEQSRLFERFFQGQNGSSRGDGSGLGLAIVAEVARKHQGAVEVESEPGQGARFTVRMPVVSVAAGEEGE